MLSAANLRNLLCLGDLRDLPPFQHLLKFLIPEIPGDSGYDTQTYKTYDNVPHNSIES